MKFNIPMTHLQGATLRIAVTTDGSVVAMCGDAVIAQFSEASVEYQPLTDMVLDVNLKEGERLTVEIDANDISVIEYGDEESIWHPSYRSVLNNDAQEFARTICKQLLTNDILDVVRAALAHGQDELRAENDGLRRDVERLRVQLAGCGTIALCNTRESLAKQMPKETAYGWSVSLDQVRHAMLREIELLEERDRLRIQLCASTYEPARDAK